MLHEKSCGAIVYRKYHGNTEILLIKHINSGHWSFPKGHVEGDETEEETAKREIMEETGIDVNLDTTFREIVSYSPRKDTQKIVVYFIGKAKNTDYHCNPFPDGIPGWCRNYYRCTFHYRMGKYGQTCSCRDPETEESGIRTCFAGSWNQQIQHYYEGSDPEHSQRYRNQRDVHNPKRYLYRGILKFRRSWYSGATVFTWFTDLRRI